MKILFTIAHYYHPEPEGKYTSTRKNPTPRIEALTSCICALNQLFGKSQCIIDIAKRAALPANQGQGHDIDVVVCTTMGRHVLNDMNIPSTMWQHHPAQAEPRMLGFECQRLLRDNLGKYDYYCYLEDDLIIHDPWFFVKYNWFNKATGNNINLLQPNRYEVSRYRQVKKAYIDGDTFPRVTEKYQNVNDTPLMTGNIMDTQVPLQRTLNPHSGCYFLSASQMQHWAQQPHFLDRDISFVGPLESAATLGIMKTFRIYKPGQPQQSFLEIQHMGIAYLGLIGSEISI